VISSLASHPLHGALVPRLFLPLVRSLAGRGLPCAALLAYLERHTEVDAGEHAPFAVSLLERLCAGDALRRRQAARDALTERRALWDAVLVALGESPTVAEATAPVDTRVASYGEARTRSEPWQATREPGHRC
jgi:hypothetical protein